jgi:hypothetical protein
LVNRGGELVDPFQPLGIALFVCEFVTQLDDLGAQSVISVVD